MAGNHSTSSAFGLLPLNLPRPTELPRSRTPSLNYLQSRLRRSLTKTRPSGSTGGSDSGTSVKRSSDTKGPLGLNLLHEPSEPQIDFIFIHGLGGGSKKTWSYAPEPGMFWPKEWLPNEPGFKNVRLHSYGYNTDWTSRRHNPHTIHDFGQALLADLHNSPSLRKGDETPIVLVAHSMGGIVAKKAYLLARHDPTYQSTARRIQALYFLATPHRGSDQASLAKLLQVSAGYGSKAFLNDMLPGWGALDDINDGFRHVCEDLQIWSFVEGVPTTIGPTSSLLVIKKSATLGLPRERVQSIEADHRHICKFQSPIDPNYLILQRAFLTTIEELSAGISAQRRDEYRSQMRKVASLLQVDQRPDATLLAINERQHAGSCQWLTEHPTFQEWVDDIFDDWEEVDPLASPPEKPLTRAPPVLWLHGRPGTGKSVATGHVIRYLKLCNFDCSFYFFRHGDRATSNFAYLLRSLAFQMAEASVEIRRAIVSMVEDGIHVNKDDHHVLWTNLFMERIFKVDHVGPQYWVIDAVDECSNKTIPALISKLSNLDFKIPIRVFITSRPGGDVGKHISAAQPRMSFLEMTTGGDGSLEDIEMFLKARCALSGDASAYQGLVSDVLAKSNGIFLWASLTVAKMEDAYSIEDKQDVLRQIPPEMDDLYTRIVASVAESQSADLAKCVLTWIICSPRPLHLTELSEAVKMHMGRTLMASARQLETMTGHLIIADNQSRALIAHETMARFLTQPKDHGFWIDRISAHSHIAEICLKVLCSADFSPPRIRRGRVAAARDAPPPSHLADYAALNFSYHLIHGSSSVDTTLLLLNKFLRTNVLTWMERIASKGSLVPLQQTAQRLKTYLSRRAKYQSPVSVESQTVAAWTSDIYHIASAFHSNLLASPSTIHSLVPYLCPLNSIIRKLFAKPSTRLRIAGQMEEDWSDRLACCLLPDPSSIACGGRLLAVGLVNGDIKLYNFGDSGTFDQVGTLVHGKRVNHLAFNSTLSMLASTSGRKLSLWKHRPSETQNSQCLWSKNLDFTPSSLAFASNNDSIVLTNRANSSVVTFNVTDGEKEEPLLLHLLSDSDSVTSSGSGHVASVITPSELMRLDRDSKLAALASRNSVVTIWDLPAMECIGNFEKEGHEAEYSSTQAIDMIFNPVAELELLAISYKNGDVVTCNPWTLDTEHVLESHVLIRNLTATSDGRVLAGAAEDGAIHLFLFETLQQIYQIAGPDSQLRVSDLAFSADNFRLFDIRGQSCNVWEPHVLVPRDSGDDTSSEPHSEEVLLPEALASHGHVSTWGEGITVMETAAGGKVVFVGRQDGCIDIYDVNTGEVVEKLWLHRSMAEMYYLEWNEAKSCLLSLDIDGTYKVNRISSFCKKRTKASIATLLNGPEEMEGVHQALLNPEATSVLICTDSSVKLIGLDGRVVAKEESLAGESWWVSHPGNAALLIAVQGDTAHIFDWDSLALLTRSGGVTLQPSLLKPARIKTATNANTWMSGQGSCLLAAPGLLVQSDQKLNKLVALDTAKLANNMHSTPLQVLSAYSSHIKLQHLIGCQRSNLFFMDTGGWVCSINLKNMTEATHYTRHFFIPLSWRTGSDAVVKIVSKTALAFARGEQLMVFHGFLEFEEKVPF